MTRMGVIVRNDWPIGWSVEYAKKAERLGFESVWINSFPGGRDPFVVLAAIARDTERVRLGTAIVDLFSRHPVSLAGSILTLQELSEGRADIGLSPGGFTTTATNLGFEWKNVLSRTREAIDMIRRLVNGETVTSEGKVFRVKGVRMFRAERNTRIYLAAEGPMMLKLAAEAADGILAPKGPHNFNRHIFDTYLGAARAAGRAEWESEVIMETNVCVAQDMKSAVELVRPYIAECISHFTPAGLTVAGIPPETAQTYRREPSKVPTQVIQDFAVCGSTEECVEQVRGLKAMGLTELYLWYPDFAGSKFSVHRLGEHERLMQSVGENLVPEIRKI